MVEHGSSNRISQVASILIGSAIFAALTHVTNTHKQRKKDHATVKRYVGTADI